MKKLVMITVLLIAATACDAGTSESRQASSPSPVMAGSQTPISKSKATVTSTNITTNTIQPTTVSVKAQAETRASILEPTSASTLFPAPTIGSQPSDPTSTAATGTWLGLTVSAENRCSPYGADDYPYSQSVESRIVADMGGIIYGPYTGRTFSSTRETDIEHIVARSEAHDSGLCAANPATRKRFSSDLLNLTLASPSVNRHQKSGKDAAEWLPELNQCWFADRVVQVKQEYGLTVDPREVSALDAILSGCVSLELVIVSAPPQVQPTHAPAQRTGSPSNTDPLSMYDDNGNGRITCVEARRHGIAPVPRDHPAYQFMNDRDGDGVVCE